MYVAPFDDFDPHFGPGSREAHLASGAREISGELSSLRYDVDDAAGLAAATRLGLGARTRLAMLN
jgi:2-phospho-L-lactate guanylyltransferase